MNKVQIEVNQYQLAFFRQRKECVHQMVLILRWQLFKVNYRFCSVGALVRDFDAIADET